MIINQGDLLKSVTGNAIIAHVCNNVGKFGRGFAQQVRERYPIVYDVYMSSPIIIGEIQSAKVANKLIIVNMIAMQGVFSPKNRHPISYQHLKECLKKLKSFSEMVQLPVHMPKIGCGLARGNWDTIQSIITEVSDKFTVWTLPPQPKEPEFTLGDLYDELER